MIFQDNVIKAYLKNVLFHNRDAPAAEKQRFHGSWPNGIIYRFMILTNGLQSIKSFRDPVFQPSMNKIFQDADDFFGRTVTEYRKWLIDSTREQLDFVLLDLIRLSQNQTVLCDCHLTVEEAEAITEASRIVFLIKEPPIWLTITAIVPTIRAFATLSTARLTLRRQRNYATRP